MPCYILIAQLSGLIIPTRLREHGQNAGKDHRWCSFTPLKCSHALVFNSWWEI